jgi:hypothetical protein
MSVTDGNGRSLIRMQPVQKSGLDELLTRKIAEKLGIPEVEVNARMCECSCEWPDDFRAKMEAAIREAGGDPTSVISPRHA